MKNLITITLSIFIFIGCTNQPLVSSTATKYGLPEKKLKKLKTKALKGDSKAGNRIAIYYEAVKNDHEEADFWYRLSAEQGNKDSALSLAYYYSEIFNEPEKAIYWYESVGSYRPDYVGYNLGSLYAIKGLFDKAVFAYCQAYTGDKEYNPSGKLSNLYLNQKKYIEGLAWGIIHGKEFTKDSFAWTENNEKLTDIKKHMTQSDIVKAQELVDSKELCKD